MPTLRYGILGSGFMGRTHAEAIQHIENAELVAVALGLRAPKLTSDYGVALCASAEELIARDDIDAVIITTPQYAHAKDTLLAAAHGKHLFIEKPMTTTVADADAIIAACAERGLALGVGYQQRYRNVPRATYEQIRSGAIGKVHTIQFSQTFQMFVDPAFGGDWSWWANPRASAVDPGRRRPARDRPVPLDAGRRGWCSAFGHLAHVPRGRASREHHHGPADLRQRHDHVAMGQQRLPAAGITRPDLRAQIMGETACSTWTPTTSSRRPATASGTPWPSSRPSTPRRRPPPLASRVYEAYIDQLVDFTNAALNGTPPPSSGADGRAGVAARAGAARVLAHGAGRSIMKVKGGGRPAPPKRQKAKREGR